MWLRLFFIFQFPLIFLLTTTIQNYNLYKCNVNIYNSCFDRKLINNVNLLSLLCYWHVDCCFTMTKLEEIRLVWFIDYVLLACSLNPHEHYDKWEVNQLNKSTKNCWVWKWWVSIFNFLVVAKSVNF